MKNTKTYDKSREYALDVSANLYAYTQTKNWNQIFRLSAIMKEDIVPEKLNEAIWKCKDHFPTFFVHLTNGFFWKKLYNGEYEKSAPILQKDTAVCAPFNTKDKNVPLFRILYSERRIAIEVFHAVADGAGGFELLKAIIARYLILLGHNIPDSEYIENINIPCKPEKTEDSFLKNYDISKGTAKRKENKAYQYVPAKESNTLYVNQCRTDINAIKQKSKELGATVNEYLTALYAYAFYIDMKSNKSEKPIKIEVPVNLRRFFNSETLRNFSLYVCFELFANKKDYTFTEILEEAKKQLKEKLTKDNFQKIINTNVHDLKMPISNLSPSIMKVPILKAGCLLYGENLITSPITNLGIIKVPNEMAEHIEYFDATLGKTAVNKVYTCVTTFNNTVTVSVSSLEKECRLAKTFFNLLQEQGFDIEEGYY